ncbi:hypothetical protein H0H93_009593 [Arthromyces matolae]|nr:hypothetical protein H0H93_009593 [Arthromyces matolae]
MIIIRPRILISASIISFALLLVSATPVPAFSGARNNAPAIGFTILRESLLVSKLRAPSGTTLFTRGDEIALSSTLVDLFALLGNITSAFEKSLSKSAFNDPAYQLTLEDIKKLKRLISNLTDADIKDPRIKMVDVARAHVKFLVLDWPSDRMPQTIKDIEACEDVMLAKKIPRDPRHTPDRMKQSLVAFKEQSKPTDAHRGLQQLDYRLSDIMLDIACLTLKEQKTIEKELELAYKDAQHKIKEWGAAVDSGGRFYLTKWEGLNNLLRWKE